MDLGQHLHANSVTCFSSLRCLRQSSCCVCFLPVPSVKWIFSLIYRCKTYFSLTFYENILHKRKMEIFLKSLNSVTKFFLLAFYFISFARAKEMLREREEQQHYSSVFSFLHTKGSLSELRRNLEVGIGGLGNVLPGGFLKGPLSVLTCPFAS